MTDKSAPLIDFSTEADLPTSGPKIAHRNRVLNAKGFEHDGSFSNPYHFVMLYANQPVGSTVAQH